MQIFLYLLAVLFLSAYTCSAALHHARILTQRLNDPVSRITSLLETLDVFSNKCSLLLQALGGPVGCPDDILLKMLDSLYELFRFYQHSVRRVNQVLFAQAVFRYSDQQLFIPDVFIASIGIAVCLCAVLHSCLRRDVTCSSSSYRSCGKATCSSPGATTRR